MYLDDEFAPVEAPRFPLDIAAPFIPGIFQPFRYKIYYGGRGSAKAICVNELIHTPKGWTRLGDIQVGDQVFDEQGMLCRVTELHDNPTPVSCFKLHFSDGAIIECDVEHEWVTYTENERCLLGNGFPAYWANRRARTTAEIVATLDDNHAIPRCCAPGYHLILAAEPIESKPMRCLTVDSPNHMYLISRWMIPTHNSWSIATALIAKSFEQKRLILCAREFQNSIADSVHRLLSNRITELDLYRYFDIQRNTIICTLTGSEFIFKGLHHNFAEIKSTEGIDLVWLEEAQSMSEDSWRELIPTIRKKGSEIWVSYNPCNDEDPTHQRFVVKPRRGNALVVKVNWDENPWFPAELEEERQWDLANDPDAYDWVWCGECRRISQASIFRNRYTVQSFEDPEQLDRLFYGVDWGFAESPTVILRMFIYDDCLYITHEAWGINVELDDLPAMFDGGIAKKNGVIWPGVPGVREWPIKADAARPETISYMRRQGFAISAAEKWPGSVEDGIAHLKGFKKIIIHPRCSHAVQEFRLYSYKTDPKTNEILPIVVKKHDHVPDAVRYALDQFIIKRGALGVWQRLGQAGLMPGAGA
jgi:phage terminase large subunit